MALLVLNLVAGFHALGTLMAVGIMILPAAAARMWMRDISRMLLSPSALPLPARWSVCCCPITRRFPPDPPSC